MTTDVDTMKKDDLMRYVKRVLGVELRNAGPDGKKNRYRAVEDVKQDCKAVQARLCQPLQENEPLEASAEVSLNSRAAPLPAQERAPHVEGGVANRQALRQNAAKIGFRHWGTKAQLEATIKDSSSRQQTLASILTKSTAARQACEVPEQGLEQEMLPGFGIACDMIDAGPEAESVPGSASGQGKPKQPRRPVDVRPIQKGHGCL